jgi:hypothetical protein
MTVMGKPLREPVAKPATKAGLCVLGTGMAYHAQRPEVRGLLSGVMDRVG